MIKTNRGDVPSLELLVLRAAHSAGLLVPPKGTRLVVAESDETQDLDLESESVSLVYCFGPDVRFASELHIARSDQTVPAWLKKANPGNWDPVEWDELLDGLLGPWTIASQEGRVVSLCHAPLRVTERFAECGVWTAPDLRGRGHAAAVTAEWAAIAAKAGRRLFYTTHHANRSSQRVAERLGLRFCGYEDAPPRDHTPRSHVHPLSRLRREA